MKFIIQLSRAIAGGLFIFSGLIKLNDPIGFSFKLNDYFAPDVLNLTFIQPLSLSLALFIVILEILLGVALLFGFWKKLTSWLLLLLMGFFTFLTFYSAYFNKITDCGCFGDAIPLTPWKSFGKDIILMILILIVFFNQQYTTLLFSKKTANRIMIFVLIACSFMGYWVLNHLPLIDFRPYAEGKSITDGMKSAEELGLKATQYRTIYYLKNKKTGKEQKVTSEAYVREKWCEEEEWEILPNKTKSIILKPGYKPPVHDFVIILGDEDITEFVLSAPTIFLLIAYNIDKTHTEAYDKVNEFAQAVERERIPFIGLSASFSRKVEQMRHELQIPFQFASMDETTLKTIIRSNPGVVLLKNGVVVKKWHYKDLPDFETVRKNHYLSD